MARCIDHEQEELRQANLVLFEHEYVARPSRGALFVAAACGAAVVGAVWLLTVLIKVPA